jgi:hypothetical protein
VLGATVEFLVPPSDCEGGYCVIKGTIPPFLLSPSQSPRRRKFFSTLRQRSGSSAAAGWFLKGNHECRRFPSCASRGQACLENQSNEPAIAIIVTTSRLGRFFREAGRPVTAEAFSSLPSFADVQRFAEVATRYHHWLANPEENAAVGIKLL